MIRQARRVVIKLGSSLLIDPDNRSLRREWLRRLIDDIHPMLQDGVHVLIVSSGAIGVGCRSLDLRRSELSLAQKQAVAGVGQVRLLQTYEDLFQAHGKSCAQVLLTLEDTEQRQRYLNARTAIEAMLELGVIPIINENDTVATSEIRYGDNDRLAARVAQMMSADVLIIFSDIDGLYDADPRLNDTATLLPRVETITRAMRAAAGDSGSIDGSGGMRTKLEAADIAQTAGCQLLLANGLHAHAFQRLLDGAPCTHFVAQETPRQQRKVWIASSLNVKGTIIVDAGAASALRDGGSLLAIGVRDVRGDFSRGDTVRVSIESGQEIARGLSAYSNKEVASIQGHHSASLTEALGYDGPAEVIHRDNLVMHTQ